jgi:hypothetical protein
MAGLTQPERYHLVAPLPPLGGWRRMLALDRRGGPTGPVVLSFAPPAIVEDPVRLTALSRDAEAGARVHQANVVQVIGLETVDDQLALVQPYRAGNTLRSLLDASGRLPAELAVRIACDAAAGLTALHAVDPGDGQPLAHGALSAERIVVTEEGTSLVEGVGTGAGRSPADDIRALAAVLAEAITGERPASHPEPLDVPGVPPALAAVIDRALGAAPGGPFPTAAALGEAMAAAFAPATVEAVAVYAEAAAPPAVVGRPPPLPEAPEVSAELIHPVSPPIVEETPSAGTPALADRTPVPDAAITFPVPPAGAVRKRRPLALLLVALALVGFGVGFALSRLSPGSRPAPAAEPSRASMAAPEPPAPAASPAASPAPAPAPAPEQAAAPAKKPAAPSLSVTATPPGEVLVDGKPAGRSPVQVEVEAGVHEVHLVNRAEGVDLRRKVNVKAPATPVRFQLARVVLEVTAPADTEVWVDGKRVGKGDMKVELWEGWHEVEARRGGARAHERRELTAENSPWTYVVTPTP